MLILLLALLGIAQAGETHVGYGLQYKKGLDSRAKLFTVGYTDRLALVFHDRIEGGLWTGRYDTSVPSAFGGYQLGISPKYGPVRLQAFFGPALISHTDTNLSTNFQFMHDLSAGFVGTDGTGISIGYKHLSNAGIRLPNRGRDFFTIRLSVGF